MNLKRLRTTERTIIALYSAKACGTSLHRTSVDRRNFKSRGTCITREQHCKRSMSGRASDIVEHLRVSCVEYCPALKNFFSLISASARIKSIRPGSTFSQSNSIPTRHATLIASILFARRRCNRPLQRYSDSRFARVPFAAARAWLTASGSPNRPHPAKPRQTTSAPRDGHVLERARGRSLRRGERRHARRSYGPAGAELVSCLVIGASAVGFFFAA